MPRSLRIALIALAVPILLWMWLGVVFAMDRAGDGGEVLGRVTINGAQLGGLSAAEAKDAIVSVEESLGSEPIPVDIEGTEFTLLPSQVGFDLDEDALVDEAMEQGRTGGLTTQLRWWLTHLDGGDPVTLQVQGTYNRQALLSLLKLWGSQAIDDPPLEGGITVQGGDVVPVYPTSGTGLDLEATADLIEAEILGDRNPVTAVTEFRVPALTDTDIDRAVERAQILVSNSVTLAKILPQVSVTFPPEVLLQSIASRIVGTEEAPEVELFFQIGPLVQYLNPIRETVETDPVDAEIVIRPDDVPIIIEGQNGVKVDDAGLPDAIMAAATSVTRTGPVPVRDGEEPDFTTDDAEALGIRNLLYTATTYYPCCGDYKNQNRIINIHRIADETNGAIVLPGDTFSLNDYVGQRTIEDGYRVAGAIIGPVVYCCDHPANVGGGVSQFTTTLYNAIFRAGLEDVDHSPHTLYFSRYPMVHEATLGFPSPDLVFRNNTEFAVYIKTEYTDDSVTVKLFGDDGGIEVTVEEGEQTNFTEPGEYLVPDPEVPPGEKEEVDPGRNGFTASTTRTIHYPDGRPDEVQTWTWVYRPFPKEYAVHPCELPPDHLQYDPSIECPNQVPALVGLSRSQAVNALQALDLVLKEGTPVTTSDQSLDKVVKSQSPADGTWLDPGSEVTVVLWTYEAPPAEDPSP